MAKVLVVGSANMDVVTPIDRLPQPGETASAGAIRLVPGGKGANSAVAAARLGGEVRFVGCVGTDAFGGRMLENLQTHGVDVDGVRRVERESGVAIILLNEHDGQNSILVSPGANALVEAPTDTAWYEWGDVLLLQLETPTAAAINAARLARQCGVRVILDPAPATPSPPRELLKEVDLLTPNETELASLTGRRVETFEEIAAASQLLIAETGIERLVTTLGGRGALSAMSESWALHAPLMVESVDSTAAGDTFAGGLAVALADGLPFDQSIRFAGAAGALACTVVGAQTSIPEKEQVLEFIKASQHTDGDNAAPRHA
ncbi:Ribokinase [Pseudobythopirellula maris]|uniref:Ribokinase n=1 Tax=Pseudobythopirellula maris TaxID=2527991 RepID=A0A5C5ZSV5_9BACT|nr:ribokinase [Pseudobythopirellula maris]TWT90306.1 Ribokinase [Pseudobythopirellula maris]